MLGSKVVLAIALEEVPPKLCSFKHFLVGKLSKKKKGVMLQLCAAVICIKLPVQLLNSADANDSQLFESFWREPLPQCSQRSDQAANVDQQG